MCKYMRASIQKETNVLKSNETELNVVYFLFNVTISSIMRY
jgi:hypothetical protein